MSRADGPALDFWLHEPQQLFQPPCIAAAGVAGIIAADVFDFADALNRAAACQAHAVANITAQADRSKTRRCAQERRNAKMTENLDWLFMCSSEMGSVG